MAAESLLTLDLATVTGWAVWRPDGNHPGVQSGTERLPKTGDDVGRFLCAYADWLMPFVELERPGRVVFEAPWIGPQTSQDVARKLLGLACMTEAVCHWQGIPAWEVNNASVRKHFIGKGRGDRRELKRLTMAACRERGWQPEDDNEADALAVMDYAAHCLRLDVPWACGALFAGQT